MRNYIKVITINLVLVFAPIKIYGAITTLNHFDPSPHFTANDSLMPPNSYLLDIEQARIKNEKPNKRKRVSVNASGFIQGAVRANGYTGSNQYGSVTGIAPNGFELGDFRGTMSIMGLFLGANPSTGQTIWTSGSDDGDTRNLTISNLSLPSCLNTIGTNLQNLVTTPTAASATNTTGIYTTSIFSESALENDMIYFGAFSIPIHYRRAGARFQAGISLTEYAGLTIQWGASSIKQRYVNSFTTASSTTGQTAEGPYSLSELKTSGSSPTFISPIYNTLATANASTNTNSSAQNLFTQNISQNLADIFNDSCGLKMNICDFDDYSFEDLNVIFHIKGVREPYANRNPEHDDVKDWPDMIFTPYGWLGMTIPVAKEQDYSKLLALPLGNNGHFAFAGGVGMTFDFAESIEVGVEGSVTGFNTKTERRPFPTHRLQRVIYPFSTDVETSPGMNWQFQAMMNAYQFLPHVSFWLTYQYIEHCRDSYMVCDPVKRRYFVPGVLECNSDWRAQFINAGLVFDIQPGMQASLMWQQPISPRNAYYPVSIMGSLSFMF